MTYEDAPIRLFGSSASAGDLSPSLSFAPKGWTLYSGQILPVSQNTALFSLLGSVYGGDGQATFSLPDLSHYIATETTLFPAAPFESAEVFQIDLRQPRSDGPPDSVREVDATAGPIEIAVPLPEKADDMPQPVPGQAEELDVLTKFIQRISAGSIYLAAAFAQSDVRDFRRTRRAPVIHSRQQGRGWHASVVNAGFKLFWELRDALMHSWTPSASAQPLAQHAFMLLAELAPARNALNRLYAQDMQGASRELARQLDAVAEQMKLSVRLVDRMDDEGMGEQPATNAERFDEIRNALLAEVGETLGLTAAAKRLGTSRQNLYQRIQRGSAIGVMKSGELVIPTAQFVVVDGREKIVEGLGEVVRPFLAAGAGNWSALQFLVEIEPNLGVAPLEALKSGVLPQIVARMAEAYLGMSEQHEDVADGG